VSAPRDFGWVVWVSVFILIVAHAVLLNKFIRVSWLLAIPCSLIAVTKEACVRRICDLGIGLRKYADDHGGRLPIGNSLSEIMPQLRPYVWSGLRYKMPINLCPLEGSYEKEPKPYVWNPQMSGKSLDELSQQKPEKLLWCPYQHGSPTLYTYHILNKEPQRLQKGIVFPIEEIR
jgi:hypothetical protein